MVERHDRGRLITLFWPSFRAGRVRLGGSAAQHARVRRVEQGDPVRLVNGVGEVGTGVVIGTGKDSLMVELESIDTMPRPRELTLLVPIADRDRMLLAAEKATELQATIWQPVYFARSRSVSPRGEGDKFHEKVRARMQAALEQSGGSWLPTVLNDSEFGDALASTSVGATRVLLDASGHALPLESWSTVSALAIGPEGGLEPDELTFARDHGWTIATLGTSTLRFETAIIAGAAVVRAAQLHSRSV
jgi:16S rRNA (uracil1498-N3)-methyltransferase